jgi:hypothetical protein
MEDQGALSARPDRFVDGFARRRVLSQFGDDVLHVQRTGFSLRLRFFLLGNRQTVGIRFYLKEGGDPQSRCVGELPAGASIPRKNNKQEGNSMKKLLLIALVTSGLAFVPVQSSDAHVYVGIPGIVGVGVGGYPGGYYYGYPSYSYYGNYPYGYYRPYSYYYTNPSYYWYNGHRVYYRHHRHHYYHSY